MMKKIYFFHQEIHCLDFTLHSPIQPHHANTFMTIDSSLATVGKGRRLGVRLPLSAFNMKPSFMMPRASLSPEEKQGP
jgi:hypothetical protein